jgi:putative ATP-dependent endonuclease of OLD family
VRDFPGERLEQRRADISGKAFEQNVATFVADNWTLEYDLAVSGLAREVWVATRLAGEDDRINAGRTTVRAVIRAALKDFDALAAEHLEPERLASHIYAEILDVSKPTVAQYLAAILENRRAGRTIGTFRELLPAYIVNAILHVTREALAPAPTDAVPAEAAAHA